jgi:hypothetical protein
VPELILSTVAGLQEPEMLLVDVPGRVGGADPLHIGAIALKVGVVLLLTVTDREVVVAHCPGLGVKV